MSNNNTARCQRKSLIHLTPSGILPLKVKDTLFHINWDDGDNFFVVAPDEKTAIEKMPDGKDMVNYVVKLDSLYQMIFKAGEEYAITKEGHEAISFLHGYQEGKQEGIKEVVDWLAIRWTQYEENALAGTYRTTFKMSNEQWESLKCGKIPEEHQTRSEMGFTEEEIKDLRHNASDDTIG